MFVPFAMFLTASVSAPLYGFLALLSRRLRLTRSSSPPSSPLRLVFRHSGRESFCGARAELICDPRTRYRTRRRWLILHS